MSKQAPKPVNPTPKPATGPVREQGGTKHPAPVPPRPNGGTKK